MSYIFLSFIPFIVVIAIIIGVVVLIINHFRNPMNPDQLRTTPKDFFLNLGIVAVLYTVVGMLLTLLFMVIDSAYPPISRYAYDYYSYNYSSSISWPVSLLIVFFPLLIVLMWLLEKDFRITPEKKNLGVHKWLSYLTLFMAAATVIGDLVTVLYYFIDGQELATGFLLKVAMILLIGGGLFLYYFAEVRNKLTASSRMIWRIVASIIVIGSIIWAFSVFGSPRTQRLMRYDEQKINDLTSINSSVTSFFQSKGFLPTSLDELRNSSYLYSSIADQQTGAVYEYHLIGQSAKVYELCAVFNKESPQPQIRQGAGSLARDFYSWEHPAGHYCFSRAITSMDVYDKYPVPAPMF